MVDTDGFVPQRHRPQLSPKAERVKPKFITVDTMNARSEAVGSKRHYKNYWFNQQLCLVPALNVFEPRFRAVNATNR
jgi:putative SOS response-associated peptidase YedK